MAPPVGDINEREAAHKKLELVRGEDTEQRERHHIIDSEEELRELVGHALHHDVPEAQLEVLLNVFCAHLNLAAARLNIKEQGKGKGKGKGNETIL